MSVAYAKLQEAMINATNNNENLNADYGINWSFVDADAYAECFTMFADTTEFYTSFDEIADAIIADRAEEARAEAQYA